MGSLQASIDGPMVVIGDVHGQRPSLASLLEKIKARPDASSRWVVFVGDFLDRGEDPRGALDLILEFRAEHSKVTAVMGNHDLAIAAALGLVATPSEGNWDKRYMSSYDPSTTFSSYGVTYGDLPALRQAMPESHKRFLAGLPWCVEHPEYLIVHAGLIPDRPYDEQILALRERDYSQNRPPWLCDKHLDNSPLPVGCNVTVVSGHRWKPKVEFRDQRILLDTSGGMGGSLSAVLLPEEEVLTS